MKAQYPRANRKRIPKTLLVPVLLVVACATHTAYSKSEKDPAGWAPGLVGVLYGDSVLKRAVGVETIESLQDSWDGLRGFGFDWSAHYEGFLLAETGGQIRFRATSTFRVVLEISGKEVLESAGDGKVITGVATLADGEWSPIYLRLQKPPGPGPDRFQIEWSLGETDFKKIPEANLRYATSRVDDFWQENPNLVEPPGRKPEVVFEGKNTVVYYEQGQFAGWPANSGVWVWGDEILVGLAAARFKSSLSKHSIDSDDTVRHVLARSLDGGETWSLETPPEISTSNPDIKACPGGIDFTHPDLAIRCKDGYFRVSTDRGKTWSEAYGLPEVGPELTSRTDYLPLSSQSCLFFLSAKEERVRSGLQDRAFCAVTRDGGKNLEFLSWMTGDPIEVRSVMPSTVQVAEGHFVSAMRRRLDADTETNDTSRNWIDVYYSLDGGSSWSFLSEVAETDTGKHNGNPPSLVRLPDGTLCVVYGYRAKPYGMRAKISRDDGRTWGKEIALRIDSRTWDIGYPRSVVRTDGKVVTIYYYATDERFEQHLAATIWDPLSVKE